MARDEKLAKVTQKLEAALAEGDYYAALQMYRTVVKRCVCLCATLDLAQLTGPMSLQEGGFGSH
jgi:hypothetical protein